MKPRKQLLSIFLVLFLLLSLAPRASAAEDQTVTIDTGATVILRDSDGDGFYEIGTADELYAFAALVNGGESSANAVLTADIVVNEKVLENGALVSDPSSLRPWTPIGYSNSTTDRQAYHGTFDGQNHTVSGLYHGAEVGYVGLFGYTETDSVIKNVGILDSYIRGTNYVAAIAGYNKSRTVENCYNTGIVVGTGNNVGGVVGYDFGGLVTGCYNTGSVTGSGEKVGGVAASISGTITGCYNTGAVTGSGEKVGGVVGYANHFSVDAPAYITNCYNKGNVVGSGSTGGIAGYANYAEITLCYNKGAVTVRSTADYETACAGGIVGENYTDSLVRSCYNTGGLTADVPCVGGIAGKNWSAVTNCYNIGTVAAADASTSAGAVVGMNTTDGTVTGCYYLEGCAADASGSTAKASHAFASGEVTYLLNGSTSEGDLVWFQTLGTDASPKFEGGTVYLGYDSCASDGYSNSGNVSATKPEHSFSDRGICTVCGSYEPAVLAENVYEIGNPGQLLWFSLHVKEWDARSDAARLVADIDMTGLPWIPIGDHTCEYMGDFDGNFHTVSGIDYTATGDSGNVYAGFFGCVYRGNLYKSIRNLMVQGSFRAVYTGTGNHTASCGGIAAAVYSAFSDAVMIENCAFIGTLSAESSCDTCIGGIVGASLQGKVTNCYASAVISAEGNGTQQLGALVGSNTDNLDDDSSGTIYENCYYDSTLCTLPACGNAELSGATGMTTDRFASGEVTYLLNGSTSEGDLVWFQTLGTDASPKFEGGTVYLGYDSCASDGYSNSGNASATKPDHTPGEAVRENEKAATCTAEGSYDEVVYCSVCDEELSREAKTTAMLDHKDADNDHLCDSCDKTLSECVDENKDYKCDICGKDLEKLEKPEESTDPTDPEEPVADSVVRLAGAHRWATSLMVADEMKANLGVEKFDAIIIASGNDFADALAGSYLSTVKNAPILLAWGKGGKFEYLDTDNIEYIKANLAEGGTVYILGGTNAVPELYETSLSGYNVKRLGGANRFETNLLILAEAGVEEGSEILVCTSTNFADSLSASATGMPILLVFNEYGKLYGKQPEFLAGLKNCTFTVIGGESAVSAKLADEVAKYGSVERLAGANRFETSVLVAEEYFEEPTTAVLAYAWNYPDGLCGGSLAFSLKAPLILTMTKYEAQAVEYAKSVGIETGIVLGGDTLISEDAVRAIFAMEAADEIVVKK